MRWFAMMLALMFSAASVGTTPAWADDDEHRHHYEKHEKKHDHDKRHHEDEDDDEDEGDEERDHEMDRRHEHEDRMGARDAMTRPSSRADARAVAPADQGNGGVGVNIDFSKWWPF